MEVMDSLLENLVSSTAVNENKASESSLSSFCFAAKVDGVLTDFVVNNYLNKYFIVITQFQKLGTLISIEKDITNSEAGTKEVYTSKVLLGVEDDNIHVAARFLAEHLNLKKATIFALGLKHYSPPVLRAICEIVKDKL